MTDEDTPDFLPELYISVDVETAGPYPPEFSMLSIGACLAFTPETTFYAEIQPISERYTSSALSISHMTLEELRQRGLAPLKAMRSFADWIQEHTPQGSLPIMVGFNAPFDWSFLNYYFHHFLGENPFGHSALDIKALFMGAKALHWQETSMRYVSALYLESQTLTHNALQDALDQAKIFRLVLGRE